MGGQPTNAVFGIFRDLLSLLKSRQPDYLAAAFDGAGPVFRTEMFADYKAQRKEMPDDLRPQIEVIRRVFEGFRVPVLIQPGFEADELLRAVATLCKANPDEDTAVTRKMVGLLVDGLRCRPGER